MKKLVLSIVLLIAVNSVYAADFPAIEGWSPSGDMSVFTPDTLWEHINGAAETFLQFGFVELTTMELSKDTTTISVGIYEMGSPLNAFGIYRTERPEGIDPIEIGGQALVSAPYQALVFKDRYYVKVDVYDGEINDETGRSIVTTIAAALPGSDGLPAVFTQLPAEGQIPGSERFTREAFLGVRELQRCVSADYDTGSGESVVLFVVLPDDGATPDSVWQSLAATWTAVPHTPEPVLVKKVPYRGLVGVIRTSEAVIGISGSGTEETLLTNLGKFSSGS